MNKIPLTELSALAQQTLARLPGKTDRATLIALVGELGAGKTTFVQALARELGITHIVQSPTYVLMKSYPISQGDTLTPKLSKVSPYRKLVHIDAYRLEKPEEFAALKPDTFLSDPHNLVCIEWPERIEGVLPAPDLVLTFSADGAEAGERYINLA